MPQWIDAIGQWIEAHEAWLYALAGVSVVVFVASLLLAPVIVARIPADYFAGPTRPPSVFAHQPLAVRLCLRLAKNVLGVILLIGGAAMLVLPGQGLLTILVGFILVDLPGKYRLEKWIISRRWMQRTINWLRRRAGRDPLVLERREEGA
jgi:hypothetical protein